jgi:hypothetical protein
MFKLFLNVVIALVQAFVVSGNNVSYACVKGVCRL